MRRLAAVTLQVEFYFARPPSRPKRILAHTKMPDLDKLVRALGMRSPASASRMTPRSTSSSP